MLERYATGFATGARDHSNDAVLVSVYGPKGGTSALFGMTEREAQRFAASLSPQMFEIVRRLQILNAMSDPESVSFVDSGADCLDYALQHIVAPARTLLDLIDGES